MRWLALVALVAACSGSGSGSTRAPTSTAADPDPDPLAAAETPLSASTLPGRLTTPWPLPIARGATSWILPFTDGLDVHVRLLADDGSYTDRLVDRGTLVGTAALDDGFALVVAAAGRARVHFLAGDGSDRAPAVVAPLAGTPVPGIASDGARVLLASTTGGEIAADGPTPLDATLLLVDPAAPTPALAIPLGTVKAAPTPWGDRRGFIVGATLLVDAFGDVAPVPGRQIRDARIFRRAIAAGSQPTSDIISLDGDTWGNAGGLVGWAGRPDDDGAAIEVVSLDGATRALVQVGDDLTRQSQVLLPSTTRGDGGQAWIETVAGNHVVWAATLENDPSFAILDATSMRASAGFVRLRGTTSRTTIVSAGGTAVLFAWTEAAGTVRYALAPW